MSFITTAVLHSTFGQFVVWLYAMARRPVGADRPSSLSQQFGRFHEESCEEKGDDFKEWVLPAFNSRVLSGAGTKNREPVALDVVTARVEAELGEDRVLKSADVK